MNLFHNLSYKTKFYLIILLFILLAIVSYKRSFSNTIKLYAELKENQNIVELNSGNLLDIDNLRSESAQLNKLLGSEYTLEFIQQKLFEYASKSKNIKIVNLNQAHHIKVDEFEIYTLELTIKGNYNDLADFLYETEKKFKYAKIVSFNYTMTEKNSLKQKELFLKVYFQKYQIQ